MPATAPVVVPPRSWRRTCTRSERAQSQPISRTMTSTCGSECGGAHGRRSTCLTCSLRHKSIPSGIGRSTPKRPYLLWLRSAPLCTAQVSQPPVRTSGLAGNLCTLPLTRGCSSWKSGQHRTG
eukprot:6654406-Prymnesium_polylepis.1